MTWMQDLLRARKFGCGFLPINTFIPNTVKLVRNSDEGIAYFSLENDNSTPNARKAILTLARNIANQVGFAPAQSFDGNNFDPDDLDPDDGDPLQLVLPVAAE